MEAVGLAEKGKGGVWVEEQYNRMMADPASFQMPVNSHGGLLSFGAPWEVPATYNVIEAVKQLRRTATEGGRQVKGARRALVYGNGGIFSASAVAVLGRAVDE